MSAPSAERPAPVSRRGLLAGAGLVAGAIGAGAWFWHRQPDRREPGLDPLWPLVLQTPNGAELRLSQLRGRPLVLNFWATWCAPCVREMPALQRFHEAQAAAAAGRGWQVLGLAVDGAPAVRDFLHRVPVSFPIGLAGFEGLSLVRALGNEQGGLPFTLVADATGRVRQRKRGETTLDELRAWVESDT